MTTTHTTSSSNSTTTIMITESTPLEPTQPEATQLIEIPRTWWSNFTGETICEDAAGYDGPDLTLTRINQLLTRPIASQTQKVVRLELEHDLICELANQANWYAYYWGEELASGAWDLGERGRWQSKGRASATFEQKLRQIIAAAAD